MDAEVFSSTLIFFVNGKKVRLYYYCYSYFRCRHWPRLEWCICYLTESLNDGFALVVIVSDRFAECRFAEFAEGLRQVPCYSAD